MKHNKKIIVNCWKCEKPFDLLTARKCHRHLSFTDVQGFKFDRWTTKCSHCGACICHKVAKMKPIKNDVLNKRGITMVMPSVKRQLQRSVKLGM